MTARRSGAFRLEVVLITLAGFIVALHAAGWVVAASEVWEQVRWHVPRAQSALVLALALLMLRAAAVPRRARRRIATAVLLAAAVSFVFLPFPQYFEGHGLMPDGLQRATSRATFEERFDVAGGSVNFHSHLGDVVIVGLDTWFGRTDLSAGRAYSTLSRLAGWLFLLELAVAGIWHRWSRRVCRYIALALAFPLTLLYFGYWELGYLSVAGGVVPLLAPAVRRSRDARDAGTLAAGFLQGLHTACHGFGILGIAGGTLAATCVAGDTRRRVVRALTFASAALAMYLGWIFLYVTVLNRSIHWARGLGSRPLLAALIFDRRVAYPLLSSEGFGEFGLFSALAGVPLLALAFTSVRRTALVPTILFGLPGLLFLFRWWPVTAPFNLDLLLSVFPGVFAASWYVAHTPRHAARGLAVLAGLHVLVWTTVGNGLFARVWVEGLR